mmetsp:Transcript_8152/g.10185  ORF Transcript_8152/g.10185 Transcript_8152/m.10185 type:complete len:101 (-) Transcript_8152:26-328(-)|eukprot:CAMPEP_0203706360 /NCGR_PEP_ID=MMETSP0091-20130426/52747_1 /ASSEMBLY_ACC=CAM_ASM_001089 /TAXON_ID=426623 /ORGANISM="Chaetoceros affinis, Strain CCMP159" /LENGTH=100 /DNA_ID=CAMNT_0050582131 /DNA_START=34 /DNA_END=336 /DNA_ORIENTATION=-
MITYSGLLVTAIASHFVTFGDCEPVQVEGYDFYPFMDQYGNDIGQIPGIFEAAQACNDYGEACQGFNSNGWLKSIVDDPCQWVKWTDDPDYGIYVKRRQV